jgi:hypothetical protein
MSAGTVIVSVDRRNLVKSPKGERGQALPMAVAALALGALLITPLLAGASGGAQATGVVGRRALERYSMDAGVEWSGWRLISNPQLTAVTTYTAVPLQPFPASVNGDPFPQTEIRYVALAGAVETQAPAWQTGGGDKCYPFSAAEPGTLSARIDVDAGQVWAALLSSTDPCVLPGGTPPLGGAPQVATDFTMSAAGSYQLLIRTDAASIGTITLSVPAASYDVRSIIGSRSVVARLVAGFSGVRVDSWQLN